MVFCHGLPSRDPGTHDDPSYEFLATRIAEDMGWTVLALTMRGCGDAGGDFSLVGWRADVGAAVDRLLAMGVEDVWLIGTATGGSVALCAAADHTGVRGVATLAARADFDDWAAAPRRFLEHCRSIGVVKDPGFPRDLESWAQSVRSCRPLEAARRLGSRSMLVVHGDADRRVPVDDAHRLVEAHGAAELRIVRNAGHRLRHDPRVAAILLGWLDREAQAKGAVRA